MIRAMMMTTMKAKMIMMMTNRSFILKFGLKEV
jgi:hypothetical protein